MFTAMIRRHHLLFALPALALGLGVGWAAFELGRGRFADAPRSVTSAPTAEQARGGAVGPQGEALPSTAVGAGAASGSDRGADAPTAGSIDQPDPLQAKAPEAQAERPEGIAQRPAAEADRQVGALSAPRAPESPATETTAPPAASPAVPQAEPAITGDAVAARSSADEGVASAPPVGSGVDEQRASPDQAAARAAAATGGPADSDPAVDAPAQPPIAAARPEPDHPAAQPDADETVAVAVPPPTERDAEAGPASSSTAPSPADLQAIPEEPVGEETARAPEAERPGGEPPPSAARAAETMKRALATLFGGAMDEGIPPAGGQAEVGAVPPTAPAAAAPDQGSALGDPAAGPPPSFDIVRIAPGGRTVIAGRAAPGAEVEIRSGERMIDRVRADRRGEWVAVPLEPLAAGVQELSLAARVEGRSPVDSEEMVVVAVPDPPPPEIALRAPDEPLLQPMQVAAAPPEDEAFAVALPREGAGGGRILQAPGRISSEGALALEMLDYDDAGRIRLSGEASAGAALRIYVDNEPAGATVVGPSGRWDAVLEGTLTPGDYTLRLDQLSPSGKPDARLETPFTRVSDPPVAGHVQVDYVIVQPGNSLWRIARRVLGEGMQYVHIYQANQAQIRDPDLIYPGQVFEVPSTIDAAG